jgi:methylenetetrahydrofolate/methylenetetrahydromethanopterin dehydrogenase (NADP+)
MSDKPKVLIHLDTDAYPSVFDRVVAVDSGVDHVFSYSGITAANVMPLVHGCIFTRGTKDLHRTAIFVGGGDLAAGEAVVNAIRRHMIVAARLTVSVMLDSNGANTTAAAAVKAAGTHVPLHAATTLVLGGTGPVGQRVARLIARHGGTVRLGSRSLEKADAVAAAIRVHVPDAKLETVAVSSTDDGPKALAGCDLVIAAGAAGTTLLPKKVRDTAKSVRVLIDLNGVPPAGIEGVELHDKATLKDGVMCYGALGVGGAKMKLHRAAVAALFESHDRVLDAEEIYSLAASLGGS